MKAKLDLGDEGGAIGDADGHQTWDLLPQPMSYIDLCLHQLGGSQCWMLFVFCHFFAMFFFKTFLINEDGRNFGPRF